MVNIFTTWCSPCVNEIPDLEKLYQEMKDKGVGVVGVTLDTVGSGGKQDEEAVKKAQVLQKKTKASYPFLIPDSGMMNGRLNGISAFPETFFVDKKWKYCRRDLLRKPQPGRVERNCGKRAGECHRGKIKNE